MRCFQLALIWVFVLNLSLAEPHKRSSFKGAESLLAAAAEQETKAMDGKGKNRDGKLFSLFNVVQFQNGGCRSQSTFSSGGTGGTNRNGTCYTSQECSSKGGTASGNCAAGFGVCCIFLVSTSGSTISQNCTYIRNPGFPSALTTTSAITYTVKKSSANVCKLRLDFETFTLLGTGNTVETFTNAPLTDGGVCLDSFNVKVSTGQLIPTICGQNTGQHMYIDLGNDASDTATLNFGFASDAVATSTTRQFEIKVTEIPCYGCCANCYQAPPGCLQYQTGLTGRLTTFNYIPTNDNHLAQQDYNICIRQEEGYCCIQYTPCAADGADAFSLDTNTATSLTDSNCLGDYISIPDSNDSCNQGSSRTQIVGKYCGRILNAFSAATANSPICDCTQPFNVMIHTDLLPDDLTAGDQNGVHSRGVCLTWMQIPCAS